jgi:hypothetical protein
MKLVIISTTIQGEKGYLPFDELASKSKFSDVTFVIAGDKGEKPFDTSKFKCKIEHMSPEAQERFHSSATIPWKDPRRRPLAWLRAIELKPDFILSVDDDNIPSADYFDKWYEVLNTNKDSIVSLTDAGQAPWHNYLRTADGPCPVYPRGFPLPYRAKNATEIIKAPKTITPSEVGLYQGISMGDPDMDAMTRIVHEKRVQISKISAAENNICLKDVWSPYNMQNTMYTKLLYTLPILWPGAGRYDDIYASFTWQQLLFNNDLFVHVGEPWNEQDRGNRDIFKADFRLEADGYVHAQDVAKEIATIKEKDGIQFLKKLIELPHPHIQKERKFFEAYLKDIEKLLK